MRKIKKKERENGMKYCTFCKPAKVDAVYRDWRLNFACEAHRCELEDECDGDHISEADFQTWYNL